jgi:hypothetical protein
MATLLMIMFRLRGVLANHQIAPVVTFGAPGIFCDGSAGSCNCGGGCSSCSVCKGAAARAGGAEVAAVAERGLLVGLGLPDSHVRNITMARDIVPRAFTCDYTLVAELLRGWGTGFKEHCSLAREGRKHMYYFVGQVMVLQPSRALAFAAADPQHPMLPPDSDLLLVRQPPAAGLAAEMAAAARSSAALREGRRLPGVEPGSVTEAVWALMDNPHPLDILGDAGAYGDQGSISRYHNPDNYARALSRLLAERRERAAEAMQEPPRVGDLVARQRARVLRLATATAAAASV